MKAPLMHARSPEPGRNRLLAGRLAVAFSALAWSPFAALAQDRTEAGSAPSAPEDGPAPIEAPVEPDLVDGGENGMAVEGSPSRPNILEVFVESHFPNIFVQLQLLKKDQPEIYFEELGHFGEMLHEYATLAARDDKLGEVYLLIRRCRLEGERIALELIDAEAEEKPEATALRRQLKANLSRLVDLERQEMEIEIRLLREQLRAARQVLQEKKSLPADALVEARMARWIARLKGEDPELPEEGTSLGAQVESGSREAIELPEEMRD